MKKRPERNTVQQHQPAAQQNEGRSHSADHTNSVSVTPSPSAAQSLQLKQIESLNSSAAQAMQRQKMESMQDGAVQRVEEEEPLQGKFETAQLVEDEELMQGKFDTAQRVEDEELMQGKFESVQLMEDEELMQGKFETAQRMEEEEPLQGKAADENSGLSAQLKTGIESLSGVSMDDVNVHYNSDKPAQMQAHAFAQGKDIHVAPGQEQHVPHEAWHIAQQAQGRVQPTTQVGGAQVNDDPSLEAKPMPWVPRRCK